MEIAEENQNSYISQSVDSIKSKMIYSNLIEDVRAKRDNKKISIFKSGR